MEGVLTKLRGAYGAPKEGETETSCGDGGRKWVKRGVQRRGDKKERFPFVQMEANPGDFLLYDVERLEETACWEGPSKCHRLGTRR